MKSNELLSVAILLRRHADHIHAVGRASRNTDELKDATERCQDIETLAVKIENAAQDMSKTQIDNLRAQLETLRMCVARDQATINHVCQTIANLENQNDPKRAQSLCGGS